MKTHGFPEKKAGYQNPAISGGVHGPGGVG